MADMMKAMGKNKGGLARMSAWAAAAGPSEAEMAAMQDELGRLDPKALEQLPADLKDALPKGLAASVAARCRKAFRASAADLPQAVGGQLPRFPFGGRARRSDERRLVDRSPACRGERNINLTTETQTKESNSMSVKIRLSRGGAKKRPYYYIVVASAPSPRDGRYIEQIGTFDPMLKKDDAKRVKLDLERCKHWLGSARSRPIASRASSTPPA